MDCSGLNCQNSTTTSMLINNRLFVDHIILEEPIGALFEQRDVSKITIGVGSLLKGKPGSPTAPVAVFIIEFLNSLKHV